MFKKSFKVLFWLALAMVILIVAVQVYVSQSTKTQIVTLENAPTAPVVIVPGAGITADKRPTAALRDRLDLAIQLYQDGKVQKLLLSGDNSYIEYNEPEAMRQYALGQGIPDTDLVLDYAGRRTYDTCYRANAIFGLSDVIVTTQAYHLPRFVFLCDNLGLNVTGIPVSQSRYLPQRYLFWQFREVFATMQAVWDIYIRHPLPILGSPEPIFK